MSRLAWHFVGETLRDGRPVPPDGEWLEHTGELVMCDAGLHASRRLLDALKYAPGVTLCRVRVDGRIIEESDDKLVASRRKIIWRIDAERVLRAFARWCAVQVLDQWAAPEVVVMFLLTGDESLRAKARDAAWDAAGDTAGDAARAATRSATRDAARAATRAAAWAAAGDAAWDAAWAVTWAAQDKQLRKMVREARAGKTQWTFVAPASKEGTSND